jgi:hypothetical protein
MAQSSSDAGRRIRLKYGLSTVPSADQVDLWARRTRQYISAGADREVAGQQAAQDLFPDFGTHVFATEADTIEALLRAAESK